MEELLNNRTRVWLFVVAVFLCVFVATILDSRGIGVIALTSGMKFLFYGSRNLKIFGIVMMVWLFSYIFGLLSFTFEPLEDNQTLIYSGPLLILAGAIHYWIERRRLKQCAKLQGS